MNGPQQRPVQSSSSAVQFRLANTLKHTHTRHALAFSWLGISSINFAITSYIPFGEEASERARRLYLISLARFTCEGLVETLVRVLVVRPLASVAERGANLSIERPA